MQLEKFIPHETKPLQSRGTSSRFGITAQLSIKLDRPLRVACPSRTTFQTGGSRSSITAREHQLESLNGQLCMVCWPAHAHIKRHVHPMYVVALEQSALMMQFLSCRNVFRDQCTNSVSRNATESHLHTYWSLR